MNDVKNGNKQTDHSVIVWCLILLSAFLYYSAGISHECLWYDEVISASYADHTIYEIIKLVPNEAHPPLYYLLLRGVRLIFGNSDWSLRLLSVFGGVALIGLGGGPFRRIFGNRSAYIYATLALFTPAILIYAHEARMYTLVACSVSATVLYGYLAAQGNRRMDWVFFGLASLVSAYLHYYGLIAAFYVYLLCYLFFFRKKAAGRNTFFLTAAVVFAAYTPWLIVFYRQTMAVKKGFWIPPVDFNALVQALVNPFGYKNIELSPPVTAYIVVFLALGLIAFGAFFAAVRKDRPKLTFCIFCLLVYCCTALTGVIVSLTLAPVFHPRYMLVCLGIFLMLLALGVSLVPVKPLRLAIVCIFAGLNLPAIFAVHYQRFNGPVQEMVSDLKGSVQPGDLVISSEERALGPFMYYFPETVHFLWLDDEIFHFKNTIRVFGPKVSHGAVVPFELVKQHGSFWLVVTSQADADSLQELIGKIGWRQTVATKTYRLPYSTLQLHVSKYSQKPAST